MRGTNSCLDASRDQRASCTGLENKVWITKIFSHYVHQKWDLTWTETIYEDEMSMTNQWLRHVRAKTSKSLKENENFIFANNLANSSFIFVKSVSVFIWFELNFSFNLFLVQSQTTNSIICWALQNVVYKEYISELWACCSRKNYIQSHCNISVG